MAIKKNHFFTNFILLISAVIVTVFVTELLCRFLLQKPQVLQKPQAGHHRLFCEYDQLLGWRHKPNAANFHTTKEYSVKESFNSKGIRGPEYDYEKDENEFRIFILGDSFAEGYTVEFEDLFSEALKNELINKRINCRVINSGTGGYSTDQELLFFQNEGKKYKPNLTIVMFYDNDTWFNNQLKYWRGYKPLFKLEDNNLVLTNIPIPKPDIGKRKALQNQKTKPFFRDVKKWLIYHSSLYNLIRDRVKKIGWLYRPAIKLHLAEEPETQPSILEKKNDDIVLIPDSFRVWERKYDSKVRDAWNITEAIIIKLQEETCVINSKLLIFYIPNRASIYRKEWEATKKKYVISDKEWNVDRVGLELENICKRNNIDFFNPTEEFRAEANKLKAKGVRLYFNGDAHWNVTGHKFTGKLLADFIYSDYLENK